MNIAINMRDEKKSYFPACQPRPGLIKLNQETEISSFQKNLFCRVRLVGALENFNQLNCRGFCCLGQNGGGGAQLVVVGGAEATRCSKYK